MFKRILSALLALAATAAFAAVDVNNASVADLDSIKGIGPGTSAKILDARKSRLVHDDADASRIWTRRAVDLIDRR